MALVELAVEWVDAATAASAVYMRCSRHYDTQGKASLRLALLQGQSVWQTEVHERQKPSVLDCTASEYLRALERAFTTAGDAAFTYKWVREKATLTLMEQAAGAFAMKYTSLKFERVENEELQDTYWQELLHEVVALQTQSQDERSRQRQRISELEAMLVAKDKLLETVLTAKQRLEEELFGKFCAVLNTKKEEIQRLQHEMAVVRVRSDGKAAPLHSNKKRAAKAKQPAKKKKPLGAKLRKKMESDEEDEEEDEYPSEEEEDEDDSDISGHDEEDNDSSSSKSRWSSSRVKQERAVDAYNRPGWKTTSQVCTAADVLSDMDAIMKDEVEEDERTSTVAQTSAPRKRPPPRRSSNEIAEKKPRPNGKETKAKAPAPPPRKPASPVKAIDSEEEDILDMLA
ncbi:hypothetical protein Poli38472_013735 [Pythium oligandrum]|uniref:DNA repair protein XRCC4 n=1 Tax=Pythium oligandrum TaxID=41045 RepID=A0A8K1CFK3_PYTOL|nr:hypothetical protein Poli38472_013735 [Pythium oligandrum]|eukprot:TMW61272.1 hypothetical protein Poli38472_013735 [Pythium oligandrum]